MIRDPAEVCFILAPVPEELARAERIEKRFGDLVAVKDATCAFLAGEIHAVCGENGAGKSTLLKVVAGMLVPDAGRAIVLGSELAPHTPREAIERGVAMVLQHFALIPVFTALENIVLGAEPISRVGMTDFPRARERALRITSELGVDLPLDATVESLGLGDRQRLEIVRALFRDAKLLVLDEPTAVLTKPEAAALYATLRRLAESGRGVVVVTHKMDEVRTYADRVTVMRRGEIVVSRPLDRAGDVAAQVDEVTSAIMGAVHGNRVMDPEPATSASAAGACVLRAAGLRLGRALDGVTFEVAAGEIVGIAGVEGNGQRELVAVLGGDVTPDEGAIEGGPVVVIREDRQTEGLVLDAPLRDNLVLGELGRFANRVGLLDLDAMEREAKARLARSGAPQDLERLARTLSGGNQQKIVVARALSRVGPEAARVLVAAQPTRGIDLAASRDVRAGLREAAQAGAGVVVLSADLDELRALAGRLLVLRRGKIVATLSPAASDEEIGRHMLGIGEAAVAAEASP
jgi:general nucleoside transport system ATP-binding protein